MESDCAGSSEQDVDAASAAREPRRAGERYHDGRAPRARKAENAIQRYALVFSVLLLFVLAAPARAGNDAPSIAPSELSAKRGAGTAPVVIDVRTAAEYAAGHIPGAVNIPYDEVAERISEVDAPHGVALYCMVGPRARKGEAALLEAGYASVLHIEGGLAAWKAAGLPVETSEATR